MNGNDALSAVTELAASQHGAFNRKQAASKSITARQLRVAVSQGRLRQPLSDVFVFASHKRTFRQRCMIVSLAGAVVSHTTAAALHEFDGFDEQSCRIEVCFERLRTRRIPDVVVHTWSRTETNDITVVDGIRCTSKARTLFQLGAVCTREQVEIALDSALRHGVKPAWIEETALRLRRPGPTGGGVLIDLMYDTSRRGALSESVLEHVVKQVLTIDDLPPPERQYVVCTGSGTKRLDLAYPDVRLGIEGHSKRHHFGSVNEQADDMRDLQLAAAGWEVIYVSWALAHNPDVLLPLVTRAYAQRQRLFAHRADR